MRAKCSQKKILSKNLILTIKRGCKLGNLKYYNKKLFS